MPLCPKCGDDLPSDAQFCPKDGAPIPVLVGKILDERYRVEELIAAGGVGAVYRGTHVALERPVAIKVLRGTFATLSEFVDRFEREARALSAIRHVNVVSVTDFGMASSIPYIVMEMLDGRPLNEEIKDLGCIPVHRAAGLFRQILAALSYAHDQGIVHRDLKPSNVMLVTQPGVGELVKILDFGLAKFTENAEVGSRGEPLTHAGTVFGTPAYMSPEQAAGKEADVRSDIYACGIMLYEMLVGHRPFHEATGADLTRKRLLEAPEPLRDAAPEADIPEALEAVVLRALRKAPAERFQSADELSTALLAAVPGLTAQDSSIPPLVAGHRLRSSRPEDIPLGVEATMLADSEPSEELSGERTSLERPSPAPAPVPEKVRKEPRETAMPTERVDRRGRPLLVPLIVAGVGLAVLGGGAAVWHFGFAGPPASGGGGAGAGTDGAPAAADASAPVDAGPPLPAARDPFAEPLPEKLIWLKQNIARPSRSKHERRRRHKVAREFREDPRSHLILGHNMSRKSWFTDALGRYERAVELDPTVRGDPLLREHLLDAMAARSGSLRARAFVLLRSTYGPETVDVLLWGAYEHPRQPAADAAVAALDELEARARLDPVLHGIGDVKRSVPCPARRAALDRLRGRQDPRIPRALDGLRTDDPEAAECLGELLDGVIAASSATAE